MLFMEIVLAAALGVGGSTMIGSVLGFLFKKASAKYGDIILSFAAGVMLAASIIGLVMKSLDYGGAWAPIYTVTGIFTGAVCINILDRFVPYLKKLAGISEGKLSDNSKRIDKVLLFVMAIAIHNLPEGIAAGVGFGSGDIAAALTVAGGIALQNIPEGMVIIAPMLASGMSKGRTLICAMGTGVIEIIGTFIGYFAVSLSETILPFFLAFAGGTMIYVISDEMIPETHQETTQKTAYALLVGFCLMIVMDFYIK